MPRGLLCIMQNKTDRNFSNRKVYDRENRNLTYNLRFVYIYRRHITESKTPVRFYLFQDNFSLSLTGQYHHPLHVIIKLANSSIVASQLIVISRYDTNVFIPWNDNLYLHRCLTQEMTLYKSIELVRKLLNMDEI